MKNTVSILAVFMLAVACGRSGSASGMIQNKGSDTMVNLAQAWAEEYRKVEPDTAIAVSGGGSGTGIAALINGTVDLANASRPIKEQERQAARKNTGKDPIEYVVAYDAVAIYLHKDNPIASISKEQLACIYGEHGTCTKWTDVGVKVPGCSGQEIVRVSRQNNSGTYVYFREWMVGLKADFKLGSRDLSGSKDVVELVERTPCAIGYSGLGYKTDNVKTACLSADGVKPCVEPTIAAAMDGSYPMSRGLFMYTLGEPTGKVKAYLEWIRSDAGQKIVESVGYAPLRAEQRSLAVR